MHEEYNDTPLTDGHVGFQEQPVYPVRPENMPDAYMMDLTASDPKDNDNQPTAETVRSDYPGYEPYRPLSDKERKAGLRGLAIARAASEDARRRREHRDDAS